MSEQGGALAKLRAAIEAYANFAASAYHNGSITWHSSAEYADLDAELVAVEARIRRLARFVKASDAIQEHAARAAITEDDLAGGAPGSPGRAESAVAAPLAGGIARRGR